MLRFAIIILAAALLMSSAAAQPTPSTRIALVIGNHAYTVVDPLPNARDDAAAVAAELRRLRFEVVELPDLNQEQLRTALEAFGDRLRQAGPEAVSFFFYAGHAAQDNLGVNYLVPVDATARSPEQLRGEAIRLDAVFADMREANNRVNVLVLDACRDWYASERGREDLNVRGLRDVGRYDGNVFIALATTPGNTVDDGAGDHSPYTTRLLEGLRTKANQPLSLVFDDIGTLVYADTDNSQSPIYLNGLSRAPRWCLEDGPNCGARQTRPTAIVLTSTYLRSLDRSRLLAFTNDNATFVDTLLARRDILAAHGIDSPARLSHFLGAIGYETGGFRAQQENLHYSADALRRVFPSRFPTDDVATEYARQPERIANRVYANRAGNGDEASGDGWRYRGRGLFMLTGRGNYRQASQWVGVDLLTDPDLLSDPEVNLAVAAAIWNRNGLNAAAEANDLSEVARRLSGNPSHGIEQRRLFLDAAQNAVMPPA
ncbi:MAG TPA: caspase family protein [Vitreimonas sp.]|nr:caspase family protein [Vitreimonas sp.]